MLFSETTTLRRLVALATTIPVLGAGFVIVTVLAIGPLQPVDLALDRPWLKAHLPWLMDFANGVADRIASQPVNLPILLVTAMLVAWYARTPRPLLLAAAAEAGFYLTGVFKLGFARPAPVRDDPTFFAGGLGNYGRTGISFPSGHAVESVLIYGTVVYLVIAYLAVSPPVRRALGVLWAAVVLNTVLVSFALGYHWMTDLLGGVLLGALLLRLLVSLDRRWPARVAGAKSRPEPPRLVTH